MATYINGNFLVNILSDGTKIRTTFYDKYEPSFAENCDVKITDKCSQGCKFCYEGCTRNGLHSNLLKYQFLVDSLHPYTEFAINGNDLDTPNLEIFLGLLKDKKVFTNITVNQNQFLKNINYIKELQEKGLIHGIGVSLVKPTEELIEGLNSVPNTVLHTIIGIVSEEDIEQLKDKNIKILFLGYKELQRGINYHKENSSLITTNTNYLYNHIKELFNSFDVVSFDNLALEQLKLNRIFSENEWKHFYMGDDGEFTFYIDLVKGEFAKNSTSSKRYPINELTIDEMFNIIKNENNN